MILRRMAWGACMAIMFAGLGMAQTTIIQGRVIGEDGAPMKDAVIKITRLDIKAHYTVKSGKKGDYFYGGLPIGDYDVAIEVNGKEVTALTTRKIHTHTADPQTVDFDLHRQKQKEDALARAADTGKLSSEQARGMTSQERAAFEKAKTERLAQLGKDKAVNDAFNAGMQANEAKQYDVAIDSFKKAAEANTNPANGAAILGRLAEAYTSLASTKTGADRDAALQQAVDAWGKVIEAAPEDAGYHNNYALAMARAGRLSDAQAELLKAATIDPKGGGRYYFNLGALLMNVGKIEEATESFKKAIEMSPDYAEAYYQLGNCLMAKAQLTPDGKTIPPPGAKEAYEQYLKLAPTGPSADGAKGMLDFIASQIQTNYVNPNAPPKKKK